PLRPVHGDEGVGVHADRVGGARPRPRPTKVGGGPAGSRRSTLTAPPRSCQDGAMALSGTAAAVSPSSRRDALITGDAVLLDLRTASFATRIVSAVIDGVLQLALLIGGILSIAWFADRAALDDGFLAAGILLASVLAYVGYPVLSELLLRGRSVGRLVMGTRVVRDDGGPVHVRQSVLRAVMAMFEIWSTTGAVALVCSVIDRRSRRIGDLLAGTMVIQERMRTHPPQRIEVPLSLRDWAQAADVGRLPLPLLQDIRAFLPRARQSNAEP